MAPEISAADLPGNEELGRYVLEKSHAKRGEKRNIIHPDVFTERPKTPEVSVDRMIRPDREMARFGHAEAAKRSESTGAIRTFYGWAVLAVAAAQNKQRKVRASPKDNNPCHADICLPKDCADDWDLQKEHATELAGASVWKAVPENPV